MLFFLYFKFGRNKNSVCSRILYLLVLLAFNISMNIQMFQNKCDMLKRRIFQLFWFLIKAWIEKQHKKCLNKIAPEILEFVKYFSQYFDFWIKYSIRMLQMLVQNFSSELCLFLKTTDWHCYNNVKCSSIIVNLALNYSNMEILKL